MSLPKRFTVVPVDVIEQFPALCRFTEKNDEILDCVHARFPDYNVLSILKILAVLRNAKKLGHREFYKRACVKHKKSFCRYLRLLTECGFIFKYKRTYQLSNNGNILLGLFNF